jgi:hypothetical protein
VVHGKKCLYWRFENLANCSFIYLLCSACIIAAGIIKSTGAVMTGGFVEGSIQVWNSTLKRKQGDDDYHGNFDAAQFERWFEQLCITLSKFGGCNIYLDGASYHKRELNPSPRKSGWRKADIQEWLRKNGKGGFALIRYLFFTDN